MDDGALRQGLMLAVPEGGGDLPWRLPPKARAPLTIGVLFVIALLLPAGLLLASALERRAVMWETARRDTEQTIAVLHQHAQRLLETQELVLDLVEDIVRGASDAEVADMATSRRLEAIVDRLPQTVSIWVSDARGYILAGSRPSPAANTVADRDFFRAQLEQPSRRYIGRPFLGRITGLPSFAMSRRRPSADGAFSGTIHVAISPTHIEEAFGVTIADVGGSAALFRPDGVLLARHPPLPRAERIPSDNPLMLALADQPRSGMVNGISPIDGVQRLYAYRLASPFPVLVGFGVDMPVREAEWRGAVMRDAAVALLSAAILCAAIWFAWRSMRHRAQSSAALRAEAERRHAAERQLGQARSLEALGRMAQGVAHDFNNLLTVVIGNLEALHDQASDPAIRAMASRSRKAAEAGAGLAGSLLAYARTQMLRVETVEIAALLDDMRLLLQDLATPAVELTIEAEPGLPASRCDLAQFRAALGNLVSNARDAMPGGGRIAITARVATLGPAEVASNPSARPGRFVAVSVTDSGSGMSREVVARAFEPFFTTKAPGVGSGLGLSHVFGLVSQLGGQVGLRSALGQGTTVTLYLPALDTAEPAEAAPSPTSAPPAPPRPGCRILVVDDKAEILHLTRTILCRAGYAVTTAATAEEAAGLVEGGERFDLLLTDVVMEGRLDGAELVNRLRARNPGLAALLMSGYAPDPEALGQTGAVMLAKPFSRQALLSAVERAVGSVTPTLPAAG